jgi:hypothetical protein
VIASGNNTLTRTFILSNVFFLLSNGSINIVKKWKNSRKRDNKSLKGAELTTINPATEEILNT